MYKCVERVEGRGLGMCNICMCVSVSVCVCVCVSMCVCGREVGVGRAHSLSSYVFGWISH